MSNLYMYLSQKDEFINTCDVSVRGTDEKMAKPKKADVLKPSKSEKASLLKKAKDNLGQKLVEAKFWQSSAETERIIINGYKIDF